jgi:hypothetical protein
MHSFETAAGRGGSDRHLPKTEKDVPMNIEILPVSGPPEAVLFGSAGEALSFLPEGVVRCADDEDDDDLDDVDLDELDEDEDDDEDDLDDDEDDLDDEDDEDEEDELEDEEEE